MSGEKKKVRPGSSFATETPGTGEGTVERGEPGLGRGQAGSTEHRSHLKQKIGGTLELNVKNKGKGLPASFFFNFSFNFQAKYIPFHFPGIS